MGERRIVRIEWMDFARALAITLVVLNHAVEYAWPLNVPVFSQMTGMAAALRIGLFTLGRLGVPLFLFLSGALHLSKQIDDDGGVLRFYRQKLLPLLLACEIWIVVYNLFMTFRIGIPFSLSSLLRKMLFLEQSDLQHMWYMAMMLGIYLAVPFLTQLVKRFSLYSLTVPMGVVFCVSFLMALWNLLRAADGKAGVSTILDLNFLGAHYGFYLLCGFFLVRKKLLRRLRTATTVLLCVLFFGLTVWFQLWSWKKGYAYNVWYNFPGLLLCSIFLFELLRRLPRRIPGAEAVSRLSLAVFFLHRPIQLLILDRLPPGQPILNLLILWGTGLVLSLILAVLVRLWKPAARILFLIKD